MCELSGSRVMIGGEKDSEGGWWEFGRVEDRAGIGSNRVVEDGR
jgi:hypothetical protein